MERIVAFRFSVFGREIEIGNGIVRVYGMEGCMSGEQLEFENGDMGMALYLEEDYVGCVLFSDGADVREGTRVRRTSRTTRVPVGTALLGRVVSPWPSRWTAAHR